MLTPDGQVPLHLIIAGVILFVVLLAAMWVTATKE